MELKHSIYTISGTIAVVFVSILATAINKPLLKYLDRSIWILPILILPHKPRAKFVQSLVHWGYPEKIATVKH